MHPGRGDTVDEVDERTAAIERSATGAGRMLPAPWRSPASFIAAIRRGDTGALRALFLFYAPLLRDQARQLGAPVDERAALVTTVLDDFVLHAQDAGVVPHDVARYLVAAVRNRVRNHHRGITRARALDERAYATLDEAGQRIVAECHSEYGLWCARAPDADPAPGIGAAIARLARWSALTLTAEELALMVGVSRHVPLRDLATQAGITYGAARVRVHRLRERFRKLVLQHVEKLDAEERREVERFLRRAGIGLATRAEGAGGHDDAV
jgi:hypothetical protein